MRLPAVTALVLTVAALASPAADPAVVRGAELFHSEETQCATCHSSLDVLTDGQMWFKVSPPASRSYPAIDARLPHPAARTVAINGHYFLPFPSEDKAAWIIGLGASEGRVFSAFEAPEQSYALVAFAPAINIDRDNHASIVNYDPADSDRLRVREKVSLWNVVAGSSQIVTGGAVTVPVYRDDNHFDAELDPGGPGNYSNAKAWADATTARTAIGLSKDQRTLTLFTVDVRGGSEGMRLSEVAAS